MISDLKIMAKTLQTALVPLLIIASLCGLVIFEYSLGRPRLRFTFLYLLTIWSIYIYLFYYIIHTSYTTYVYMSLLNLTVMCFAIITILVSLLRYKKLKICLCKLSIVDDTLEILGISKEYQRLYDSTIRKTIGSIALICFMNIFDSIWLNYDDGYSNVFRLFAPFVGNYCLNVNIFNDLIGEIILEYVNSRFQRINGHILNLLESIEHSNDELILLTIRQQRTKIKKFKSYMWIIMHVHLQLCLISRELNKIFSIQMTLQMACYFTIFVEMTREINTIYNWSKASYGQILCSMCTCLWILMFSAKILIFNYTCQIVCDKTKETLAILHKLSNNNLDNDLREQTLQFILQIKQREVKFSGMGLFYFGYNFVRQFYISIATVMVITIQMSFSFSYSHIFPLINNKK